MEYVQFIVATYHHFSILTVAGYGEVWDIIIDYQWDM